MTPADPDRLYALIETGDGVPYNGKETEFGELWRSDDNGKTFKLVNSNRNLGGRQAYYTRTAASTDNPNEVYFNVLLGKFFHLAYDFLGKSSRSLFNELAPLLGIYRNL